MIGSMTMGAASVRGLGFGLLAWGLSMLALGCDTVEPEEPPQLVVEAFLDAGQPLPTLTLRRTQALDGVFAGDAGTAVTDAAVELVVDGEAVPYASVTGRAGRYAPQEPTPRRVEAGQTFALTAAWGAQQATAEGRVPPRLQVDSVSYRVPEAPVQAVQLDSLRAAFDSLGVNVETAWIYPVEVTLWWTTPFDEVGADSAYWVETRLEPVGSFSSDIVDFFLLPGEVLRERDQPRTSAGARWWTGVYAVQVEQETDLLPAHQVRVALVRSGQDYARFATTRTAPNRREPITNVRGGLGIVAGLSVDSLRLRIETL